MSALWIGDDWGAQIERVRNEVTEDTNLIRFGNDFYRICRGGTGTFRLTLHPRRTKASGRGVELVMQEKDLYVTHIEGRRFETYSQMLDMKQPKPMTLDAAIEALPSERDVRKLFDLQSIIVFCVAESLRNDHTATKIGQFIRTSTTGIKGVPPTLNVAELLREAHAWGQTSEAIIKALSKDAREIVLKPRAQLTPAQKQFSERVNLSKIDAELQSFAKSIKVLKRPG